MMENRETLEELAKKGGIILLDTCAFSIPSSNRKYTKPGGTESYPHPDNSLLDRLGTASDFSEVSIPLINREIAHLTYLSDLITKYRGITTTKGVLAENLLSEHLESQISYFRSKSRIKKPKKVEQSMTRLRDLNSNLKKALKKRTVPTTDCSELREFILKYDLHISNDGKYKKADFSNQELSETDANLVSVALLTSSLKPIPTSIVTTDQDLANIIRNFWLLKKGHILPWERDEKLPEVLKNPQAETSVRFIDFDKSEKMNEYILLRVGSYH
jgi:hypothetical protein